MKNAILYAFFLLIGLSFLEAASPSKQVVALIWDVQGTYITQEGQPVKVGMELTNKMTLSRKEKQGYIQWVDGNLHISPKMVKQTIQIDGMKPLSASQVVSVGTAIGGTRIKDRPVDANPGWLWHLDPGAVVQADVEKGRAVLVISSTSNSESEGRYFPLKYQVKPGYLAKEATYRTVSQGVELAHGAFQVRGKEMFLPFSGFSCPLDTTIQVSLRVVLVSATTGQEEAITAEFPFTVLASDGFIEKKVAEAKAQLSTGAENPDQTLLDRMARLQVYEDYQMILDELTLRSAR